MADALEKASDWLAGKLAVSAARPVSYSRGLYSVVINATIGQTVFDTVIDYSVLIQVRSRDYLFQTKELVLNGVAALPERGDRITDDGKVYEVLAPGKEPHYRFSDPYRFGLRVHTKQVG